MAKVVFITGCASGVGKHLVGRFAQDGYRVLATDIDYAGLKRAASEERWPEQTVWLRKLDITQKGHWEKLMSDLFSKWQGLDVMCNVAGYLKPGRVHETELQEVDRHLDINIKGLIYGSKFAAERMVSQGSGLIVNIASLAGVAPIPGISLYSTSKFAVRGFSLSLAQELKPHGVDVSVLCPDAIETPMLDLQEDYEEAALTFSGGKTLTVNDIGDAIFSRILKQRPVEVLLPAHRGWLAKLGNTVPGISFMLSDQLGRIGASRQRKRRQGKVARSG